MQGDILLPERISRPEGLRDADPPPVFSDTACFPAERFTYRACIAPQEPFITGEPFASSSSSLC